MPRRWIVLASVALAVVLLAVVGFVWGRAPYEHLVGHRTITVEVTGAGVADDINWSLGDEVGQRDAGRESLPWRFTFNLPLNRRPLITLEAKGAVVTGCSIDLEWRSAPLLRQLDAGDGWLCAAVIG